MSYEALVARAAGLSTHLLGRDTLTRLAELPDLNALGRELGALGVPLPAQQPSATELELAVRRHAGLRMRELSRWDPAGMIVPVLVAEAERRALRTLVRGLVEGLAPASRLDGLVPTPGLAERELGELSRQATLAGMVAMLTTWRSPWAEALASVRGSEPDLVHVELALAKVLARRYQLAARRAGGAFRDYLRQAIDLENLGAVLLLAGREAEAEPGSHFHDGGSWLVDGAFVIAARAESVSTAAHRMAAVCPDPDLAERILTLAEDPVALERGIAAWRRAAWSRRARMDPLGAAPVLAYALRLEEETRALQRVIWAMALGAPCELRLAAEEAR